MASRSHTSISFPAALGMIGRYSRSRIREQVRSVAFIIVYLVAFQVVVFGTMPADAIWIGAGIGMVILGLTAFLDGLTIGVMPLGERVGVRLPERTGVLAIAVFGVMLGIGSTLAEPAVAALRGMGSTVTAWKTPLLFTLIEQRAGALVSAIAVGVGIAVALGMLRFFYNLSIKPFVYIIVPLVLLLTAVGEVTGTYAEVIGLAWDAGAVTTGAVTVPLVLALGVGVSRAAGTRDAGGGGFGIVMLASLLPIGSVLVLGIIVGMDTPAPVGEEAFFAPANRVQALEIFEDEDALRTHAFTRAGEAGRRAYFDEAESYQRALYSIAASARTRRKILGDMPLSEWLATRASAAERDLVQDVTGTTDNSPSALGTDFAGTMRRQGATAVRAILPLVLLLLIVLVAVLRDRPRHTDELVLGIGLAIVGMTILSAGIQIGLVPLGDGVGRELPRAFQSDAEEAQRVVINDFDRSLVREGISSSGSRYRFFFFRDEGKLEQLPFVEERYDPTRDRYVHVVSRPPLFGPALRPVGIALVILFGLGMGYGATRAEPALSALGRTAEQLTAGAVRRHSVVSVVALGVGLGLAVGVARMLYPVPLAWLLVPLYGLLLPLTSANEESFAALSWDSGGVTTGTVTVPLVMAMGLGLGRELNVADGFGILALASAFPILAMLLYGLVLQLRHERVTKALRMEESNER